MANNRNRPRNNDDNFFISGSRAGNKPRNNRAAANAGPAQSKSLLNRSRNFFGFGAAPAASVNNSGNRNAAGNRNASANAGRDAPGANAASNRAPNKSGSIFNRIFSFSTPTAAPTPTNGAANVNNTGLINAINQLKNEVNGANGGNGASLPARNQRLPTATLVNGILKKMGNDTEKLQAKITELNTQLRNQKAAVNAGAVNSNALKNKEKTIRELKSVIKKLYALLYKIYSLHTVSNNARAKHLENIQQTLVRNKAVLNVVNRIISENNQILNIQRGAENLQIEREPLVVTPGAGEVTENANLNRNQNRNGMGLNRNRNAAGEVRPAMGARNNSAGAGNNLYRNIGEIPSNNRPGEAEEEPEEVEEEEEPEGEVNLVIPNRQIEQIMAEERANENVSLSNLIRRNASGAPEEVVPAPAPEEAGNTLTANRESPEETAEMPLNNNTMGRAKSVSRMNRSKKIMAVLKKMEPISVNNALAKLRNY